MRRVQRRVRYGEDRDQGEQVQRDRPPELRDGRQAQRHLHRSAGQRRAHLYGTTGGIHPTTCHSGRVTFNAKLYDLPLPGGRQELGAAFTVAPTTAGRNSRIRSSVSRPSASGWQRSDLGFESVSLVIAFLRPGDLCPPTRKARLGGSGRAPRPRSTRWRASPAHGWREVPRPAKLCGLPGLGRPFPRLYPLRRLRVVARRDADRGSDGPPTSPDGRRRRPPTRLPADRPYDRSAFFERTATATVPRSPSSPPRPPDPRRRRSRRWTPRPGCSTLTGRRVGGRCQPSSRSGRGARPCTRRIALTVRFTLGVGATRDVSDPPCRRPGPPTGSLANCSRRHSRSRATLLAMP